MKKEVLLALSLPSDLDQALRVLAFHNGRTKGDFIVALLEQAVENNREQIEKVAPGTLKK